MGQKRLEWAGMELTQDSLGGSQAKCRRGRRSEAGICGLIGDATDCGSH
jgi:hypothetical protein